MDQTESKALGDLRNSAFALAKDNVISAGTAPEDDGGETGDGEGVERIRCRMFLTGQAEGKLGQTSQISNGNCAYIAKSRHIPRPTLHFSCSL